jgi:predicted nucleic acid binding AN1-type Zn finger protein
MNSGKTVFAQIIDFLPKYQFDKYVFKYNGNYKIRSFSCWDQMLSMSFAQLTYRESLRDIEACLKSRGNMLYHLGFKGNITRTNISNANEKRDWRIYHETAMFLINKARILYKNDESLSFELDNSVYAIDSTIIDLCLTLFPWAKFRKTKAAIKLHTAMDIKGSIPTFIHISEGTIHDVNILDLMTAEPGAIYVMDRAYLDFERLYSIHKAQSYFLTRAKKNTKFRRISSRPVRKDLGIRCDQTIKLSGYKQSKKYPKKMRRIKFYNKEQNKQLIFLTNNFELEAEEVAEIYKNRWKIELFFKWIKQNLRIKKFYGNSINAVKTQIWIAISTYLLTAIIKKELNIFHSLNTILQIFSISIFEKTPIYQLLTDTEDIADKKHLDNTLKLFDL